MNEVILGVGEHRATNKPDEALRTVGLGSCVALILLDPRTRTVGMAHVALPDSTIDPNRARERPAYFADTALSALIQSMATCGCSAGGRGMIAKLVGGANILDAGSTFNIGRRNILVLEELLLRHGLGIPAEDVGGNISRSVIVEVNTGRVLITSSYRGDSWEI